MLAHLLEHDRCALWAGMGLGKTPVVETFLEALYLGGESQPTLVLGPLRVARSVWSNEVRKWEHLRGLTVVPIIGAEKDRLAALRMDAQVYTTNYENLVWLIDLFGDRCKFGRVLCLDCVYFFV
jgi:SNF2 family DNA or RNA helicase